MKSIALNTVHGYTIAVPPDMTCITTYVVLEQERWFESEIDFLLKYLGPGMNVIDVGANLGVYALPLAKRVGLSGRLFAYEPGSEARNFLSQSVALNALENVTLSPEALSSQQGRCWLEHRGSSELNTLSSTGDEGVAGEWVGVTTLDAESRRHNWQSVDFIKIDAEGQEAKIIVGGKSFFSQQAPLVMYEVVDKGQANQQLRWMFELLDYNTYQLSGDNAYLVKLSHDAHIRAFDLNYFSAKKSLAEKLVRENMLVNDPIDFVMSESERESALAALLNAHFAKVFGFQSEDFQVGSAYAEALLAYACYLYLDWPVARRHGALLYAYGTLNDLVSAQPTAARVASFARVAQSIGARAEAIAALDWLKSLPSTEIEEPFFPVAARFDALSVVDDDLLMWFTAAVIDRLLSLSAYSGKFGAIDSRLMLWLANSPYTTPEIYRRTCLRKLIEGEGVGGAMPDPGKHANADLWQKQEPHIYPLFSKLGQME